MAGALAVGVMVAAGSCTRPPLALEVRPDATGQGHRVQVSGWIEDRSPGQSQSRLQVIVDGRTAHDGPAGGPTRQQRRLVGSRTERRVDLSIPLAPGNHEVCVRLGEVAASVRTCRTVTVPAGPSADTTPPPGQGPSASSAATRSAPPPRSAPDESASPAPIAGAVTAAASGGWQAEMLGAVNSARAQASLGAVAPCPNLDRSAQAYAQTMAEKHWFNHTGPDGSSPMDRARATGYVSGRPVSVGENIAQGHPDVAAVMKGWLASPGHRANILSPAVTHLGVGRADASWVQELGRGGTC